MPVYQVTDYRLYAYEVSSGAAPPNFYCVRLSWNGRRVRQLCDPNDKEGFSTGVVPDAIFAFWEEMKKAHWVDPQTRIITLTLPLRANNGGMRMRLTYAHRALELARTSTL